MKTIGIFLKKYQSYEIYKSLTNQVPKQLFQFSLSKILLNGFQTLIYLKYFDVYVIYIYINIYIN